MWCKAAMSKSRKNYVKPSEKDGIYNYRRGIPEQYRSYFLKADGSLRGREWKETLGTANKPKALALAVRVNDNFEQTLAFAKAQIAALKDASQSKQVERFISGIKSLGIHPEQAPSINESEIVQQKWLQKRNEQILELEDLKLEMIHEPLHYKDEEGNWQQEKGYIFEDGYHLIEDMIEFLKGQGNTNIKSKLRPTLGSATEEYIEHKIARDPDNTDSKTKQKLARVNRVTQDFAAFIGGGSVSTGMDVYLDKLEKRQARNWMNNIIDNTSKAPSSIGREMSILSAIYMLAVSEHSRENPELRSDYNPFGKLRSNAEDQHSEQLRLGKRKNLSSRAWTPDEMQAFIDRLSLMNDQAKLVSMICIHSGARLKDVCGLRIDELFLNTNDDSYLEYKDNRNRKITKDSIERIVPLFGDLLAELKSYVANLGQGEDNLFPSYCDDRKRGSDNLSQLLNTRHLDTITKDPRFKMHGLRDTLSSKFLATNVPNKISGYLIGWRDKTTVGMQSEYQRGGYPHKQMLEAMKAAHAVKEWGTVIQNSKPYQIVGGPNGWVGQKVD